MNKRAIASPSKAPVPVSVTDAVGCDRPAVDGEDRLECVDETAEVRHLVDGQDDEDAEDGEPIEQDRGDRGLQDGCGTSFCASFISSPAVLGSSKPT